MMVDDYSPDRIDLGLMMITGLPDGTAVQVRPRFDGLLQLWEEVSVVTDASDCDHTETICSVCLVSWLNDWELRLVNRADGDPS
jgi:hypothetical protein